MKYIYKISLICVITSLSYPSQAREMIEPPTALDAQHKEDPHLSQLLARLQADFPNLLTANELQAISNLRSSNQKIKIITDILKIAYSGPHQEGQFGSLVEKLQEKFPDLLSKKDADIVLRIRNKQQQIRILTNLLKKAYAETQI